jgi:hypothetical protein
LYPKYNYTTFGFGNGITYGKLIGLGVAGRYGSLVGFGFEAGAGIGYAYEHGYLSYSAGLRVYPINAFYISFNYGVIGLKNKFTAAEDEAQFVVGGPSTIHGASVLSGFNIRFPNNAVLTLAGGVSLADQGFKDIRNVKDIFQSHHLRPAWNVAFSGVIP